MLSRRSVLAAFVAASSNAACGREPDSTAVYEALFRRFGEARKSYLVLEEPLDATVAMSDSKDLLRDFPVRRTRHRAGDFGTVAVRLLSESEFLDIFNDRPGCENKWAELRRRFPDTPALIQLSAVCFKESDTEALVLLQVASGCFGGVMEKIRFARKGSTWKVLDSENLWRA